LGKGSKKKKKEKNTKKAAVNSTVARTDKSGRCKRNKKGKDLKECRLIRKGGQDMGNGGGFKRIFPKEALGERRQWRLMRRKKKKPKEGAKQKGTRRGKEGQIDKKKWIV